LVATCHEAPEAGQSRYATTFEAQFPPEAFRGLDRSPAETF
jgi:hypothetical protein